MQQRSTLALGASLLILFAVSSAGAALTPAEIKCQKTVAKQGRVFYKKRFKALSKCQDSINSGNLATTTDCELEAQTLDKLNKAETKFRGKIADSCPDMVVAGLDFGGDCSGATTSTALQDCQVEAHEAATNALIETVYGQAAPPSICSGGPNNGRICALPTDCPMGGTCVVYQSARKCDGGMNNDAACSDTGDCPSGACVLSPEQRRCTSSLAKALGKLGSKRQTIIQSCKKKVASDKLPLTTDCVAASQDKIDKEFTKAVTKIQAGARSVARVS